MLASTYYDGQLEANISSKNIYLLYQQNNPQVLFFAQT